VVTRAAAGSQPVATADAQALEAVRAAVAGVPDPEIPVLTIAELGILRDVRYAADGHPEVVLTPTYSGCPATEAIRQDVLSAARALDPQATVVVELAPAWTTDWITETGRTKLVEYGIAPPRPARSGPVPVQLGRSMPTVVRCPRCESPNTELISQFGSTPCKALRRCLACAEPFDEFKAL
jgi:ring-1,2-phenylacetyl-CoA epoxidase subunit PaaD